MPKTLAALAVLLAAILSGCSDDDGGIVVYSGRNENLVRPLLDRFEEETGIELTVRYGDTTEMLATLLEEEDSTRADVFLSQDAGALGKLSTEGMLDQLPASILDLVEERFRDPDGRWVGVTGRARVIAYNTDELSEDELPRSVVDLVDPKWKGKVGFPPSNASFIAFVSALREQVGESETREFLEGLKANDARTYDDNVLVLDAVSSGEVLLGLVNHYYLYGEYEEAPTAPVKNYFSGQHAGGEGTFVNVSGVGLMNSSDEKAKAQRFVEFMLGEDSQRYFRDETAEYPLRRGVGPIPELPKLDSLRTIDVPLTRLGRDIERTVELIKDVGFT